MPHDLISSNPIQRGAEGVLRCASQLSQFMDQTNPLSGSRTSVASRPGPGGLTRERAGFGSVTCTPPTTAACARSNAGRSEHRPDQLAGAVRAAQQYGFLGRRTAAWWMARSPTRSTTCRPSRKAVRDRPGQRLSGRELAVTDELVSALNERIGATVGSVSSTWTWRRRRSCRWPPRSCASWSTTTRTPRADGRQHAAPGRAVLRLRRRWSAPVSSAWPRSTRAPWSRRAGVAWSTMSTPTASSSRVNDARRWPVGRRGHLQPHQSTSVPARTPTSTSAPSSSVATRWRRVTWWPTAPAPTWASSALTRTCWSRSCPGTATTSKTRSSSASASSPRPLHLDPHRGLVVMARDTKLGPGTSPTSACPSSSSRRLDRSASSTSAPRSTRRRAGRQR